MLITDYWCMWTSFFSLLKLYPSHFQIATSMPAVIQRCFTLLFTFCVYLSLMPLQRWSLHQRICQNFSIVLQNLVTLLVSNPTISLLQIYNYFANQCTFRCLLASCLHPKPKVKYLMDFFRWYFILSKEEQAQGWQVFSILYIC